MLHASIHGIDSHGVRLLPHYQAALRGGRVNGKPQITFNHIKPATGMLDADHAHGARAMFEAVDRVAKLTGETGIAAVAVSNSSHFGAAGAYALELARGAGWAALCLEIPTALSGFMMARNVSTAPTRFLSPSQRVENPWLLDMATSSIPGTVFSFTVLPAAVAAGHCPRTRRDAMSEPDQAQMLAPLGGAFGFKGAGLAGVAEILSAMMTGMHISDLMSMDDPDMSTPRQFGAFIIAFDPQVLVTGAVFSAGMAHYSSSLRDSQPRDGAQGFWRQVTENGRRRRAACRRAFQSIRRQSMPSDILSTSRAFGYGRHRNRIAFKRLDTATILARKTWSVCAEVG